MEDKAFQELLDNARLAAAWLKEQEMAAEQLPEHAVLDDSRPTPTRIVNADDAQPKAF